MNASMHCCEPARGRGWPGRCGATGATLLLALLLGLGLLAAPARAHKSSDAYLQLAASGSGSSLRVDVALRDLDAAIDLDADGNGALDWGEVKAAWPAIDALVQRQVQVEGCRFTQPGPALERRADGVYAALAYTSPCPMSATPVLRYSLLADVDPTHRGLLSIAGPDGALSLRVLDPRASAADPLAGLAGLAGAGQPRGEPSAATDNVEPLQFVREGVHHIVTGYDHVLFLLCLLFPAVMRRMPTGWQPVHRLGDALWPVFGIVTAFTLAHSITLALAALQWVSLPAWFIEPAIALTIVLAAFDNLRSIFGGRRVLVSFLFGLIHGFGFAGVLAEMELPAARFAWALFQFNLGLELGQLVIVLCVTALLFLARSRALYTPMVIRGGSVAAIMVGVLWFIERTADLSLLPL